MYLVGGNPGTAEQSVELLRQRHPAIRIAGHLCPEMGFEADPERLAAVITAIASARPDIVFVALGSPKQERLIAQLRRLLPATWFIGVGAAFSFLTGDIARAPAWMRRSGLEWLHRLLQEPGRLARRYLVENAPYAAGLLLRSAARRVTGRRGTVRRPLAD
jgi:N-acetylglucosaminyldiphosphoundecaprenol N-acetyl-beta-D-mannosaminyltransferase